LLLPVTLLSFSLCCDGAGLISNGTDTVATFNSQSGVNYGLKDWASATYSGTPIIVDCVTFTCQGLGRRRLIHAFGAFSPAKVIPFPDSTMMSFSDPCEITSVITPGAAAGKIGVIFYPFLANCVYANPMKGIKKRTGRLLEFHVLGFQALAVAATITAGVASSVYSCWVADYEDPNPVPSFPIAYIAGPTADTFIATMTSSNTITLSADPNIGLNVLSKFYEDKYRYPCIVLRSLALVLIAWFLFLSLTQCKSRKVKLSSQVGPWFVVLFCLAEAIFGLWKEARGVPFSEDRATPPWTAFTMFWGPAFVIASSFAVISPWLKIIVNKRLPPMASVVIDLLFVAVGVALFANVTSILADFAFNYSGDNFLGGAAQETTGQNDTLSFEWHCLIISAAVFAAGVVALMIRLLMAVRAMGRNKSAKKIAVLMAHTIFASGGIIGCAFWAAEPLRLMWKTGSPPKHWAKMNTPMALDNVLKMYMMCMSLYLSSSSSSSSSSSTSSTREPRDAGPRSDARLPLSPLELSGRGVARPKREEESGTTRRRRRIASHHHAWSW